VTHINYGDLFWLIAFCVVVICFTVIVVAFFRHVDISDGDSDD
jgi:hypothetical protein